MLILWPNIVTFTSISIMSLKFKSLILFVVLLFCLQAQGQDSWSLQKCIDYALQHNIQARQSDLNAKFAKSTVQQSNMDFLPSLNGNASHNYNYGRTIDQFAGRFVDQRTQTNNFSLSSSFMIFNGFQLVNTRKQSKLEFAAAQKDAEQTRNDVAMTVIAAYLQVLFNQEFTDIAKSNRDATEKQLIRIQHLVSAGALPMGGKLDMEAQLANEELNEVTARNRLEISYIDLTQSMNLDTSEGFKISKPNFTNYQYGLLEIEPRDIYNIALQNQPGIAGSEMRVRSAQTGLALARGSRSPRLSMNGTFGSGYSDAQQRIAGYNSPDSALFGTVFNTPIYYTPSQGEPILEKTPFNTQIDQNLNRSFGFNLTIPIFNGWASKTSVDRAKINYQRAQLNDELVRDRLYKDIQQAHADAAGALRKYNASAKSVNAMQEAFKYAESKFELGALNALDFLIAKNNLDRAKSDLLQAQYEYIFKTKILDFYLGKPLSF